MDLRERRDRVGPVDRLADVERDPEGLLEERDGLLGVAEHERQPAEVVEQAADVERIVDRLVELLRALPERAGAAPLAGALRDERSLEVDVCDRLVVAQRLGELERALDVLACRLPVALAAVAARAPLQDVRAEPVAALA